MDSPFNPYREWLGLAGVEAKPDHYTLLALDRFESDPAKIKQASEKAITRVRSFRPGDKAKFWAGLLDELDLAKRTLSDPAARAQYDNQLRSAPVNSPAQSPTTTPGPSAPSSANPPGGGAPPSPMEPWSPVRYGPAGPAPEGSPASTPAAPAKNANPSDPYSGAGWPGAPSAPGRVPTAPRPSAPVSSNPAQVSPANPAAPALQPSDAWTVASAWNDSKPSAAPVRPNPAPASPAPQSPTAAPVGDPMSPWGSGSQAGLTSPAQPNQGYAQASPAYGYAAPHAGANSADPMSAYSWQGGGATPSAYPAASPASDPMSAYPMAQAGAAPLAAAWPSAQPQSGYADPMSPLPTNPAYAQPSAYGQAQPVGSPNYPQAMPAQGYPAAGYDQGAYGQASPGYAQPVAGYAQPAYDAGQYAQPAAYANPAALAQPQAMANPAGYASPGYGGATSGYAGQAQPASPQVKAAGSHQSAARMANSRGAQSMQMMLVVGTGVVALGLIGVLVLFAFPWKPAEEMPENNAVAMGVDPLPQPGQGLDPPLTRPRPDRIRRERPTKVMEEDDEEGLPPPESELEQNTSSPLGTKDPMPTKPEMTKPEMTKPSPEVIDTTPTTPMPTGPGTSPPATTPEMTKPEPTTPPKPEPPMAEAAPPTKQELEQLGKALNTARIAMGERNFADAKTQLAEAEKLAKLPEHKEALARLKEVDMYLGEFWRAVGEGLSGMKSGDTISVGSTEVAVVEVTPDLLIIRVAGGNRRIPKNELPAGLAMAIANRWFNSDAVNDAVRGTFHLVDPNGRKDEARRLFQLAKSRGVDTAGLSKAIEEKYEF